MNGIAPRATAYDHEFVEMRVVSMLQEVLEAIRVVAENDDSLTDKEHALACYLTFYRQIDECVWEIPSASKLKSKHRTAKRALRAMLERMKTVNLADEFDNDGIQEPTMLAFGELAIEFIEVTHKIMLDATRQFARDSIVKAFAP